MITADMRKVKLGRILDVKRGASLSGQYYDTKGKYIRLTLSNIDYPGGGFKENTSKDNIYFTGPIKDEFIMKKGDIITPLTEQVSGLLGETARIPEDDKYIQSGDVGHVIPDTSQLDDSFAYYLMSSPSVKQQLSAAAQQTKIRHTSPDKIKDCIVWLPCMTYQQKAGKLLDSINERIRNNNAISSELESLAKTIYDYWFLQFDFPDENGRPYRSSGGKMTFNKELKREIPYGWKVNELKDILWLARGTSYSSSDLDETGIPMINLGNFCVGGGYKNDNLKHYRGKYRADQIIKPYDLIVCLTQQTDIDPSKDVIGFSLYVPDAFEDSDIIISQDLSKIECNNVYKGYLWMLFKTSYFHKYITGYASGSNILHLNVDGIYNYKDVIPDRDILNNYYLICKNIWKEQSRLLSENQQLSSLRDFLIPLLMNGQVTFKEAEIIVQMKPDPVRYEYKPHHDMVAEKKNKF